MEPLVQGTNDSSILSKYSMVQRGYFDDEAIEHFVSKDARRSPLIHLGYFARAIVMDYSVKSFVRASPTTNPQILSLGAGFDTTYFRLCRMFPDIVYFEVDLQDVVDNKIAIIKNATQLNSKIFDVSEEGLNCSCLRSRNYNIFTHDLSDTDGLEHKLSLMGFDLERPTLLFSECAVTYIDEERSTALIKWIKDKIKAATLIVYEQFNPDDGFGKVMVAHFNKIQSPLRSLPKYRTMEEQQKRYSDAGWEDCKVISVVDLFQHILDSDGFSRAFRVEPFDEWEEFHLKCCHYSLAIATHNEDFLASFPDYEHKNAFRKGIVMQPIKTQVLERYAHSCAEVRDRGVLVFGGFGSEVHRHGRSKEIIYVGTVSKTVSHSLQASSLILDCLYATCTAMGEDEFILFGGRTSPAKEVNVNPVLLKAVVGDQSLLVSSSDIHLARGDRPSPRYRHTAVCHQQSLLVFGGRNKELQVFEDLWELRRGVGVTWQWSHRMSENGSSPSARFSHAMTTGGGKVYITGGIDAQLCPLNDIWELESNEKEVTWRNIIPQKHMPSVYSHSLHYHHHQLIFIGGVNSSPTNQPSLTILDLNTLQITFYALEIATPDDAVMLHNHSTILNKEESTITCYGGGGNCFSFGTHFNKHPLEIRLCDAV